jgi:hypothetical protein
MLDATSQVEVTLRLDAHEARVLLDALECYGRLKTSLYPGDACQASITAGVVEAQLPVEWCRPAPPPLSTLDLPTIDGGCRWR